MTDTPYASVRDYGAMGNGQTDDTISIQAAINFMNNNYGGGVVKFPGGNYITKSGIIVPGSIVLEGMGRALSIIDGMAYDVPTVTFDSSCSYAGARHLGIYGRNDASAKNSAVVVAPNVTVIIADCNIWFGYAGLNTGGVDGCVENCYIYGYTTCLLSVGANWYMRNKFDSGLASTKYSVWQKTLGAGILENHFEQCDNSHAICIDDGGNNSAVTVFEGCVVGAVQINNSRVTILSACEFGGPTINAANGAIIIAGSYAFAPIAVQGNKTLAGNVNIS